MAIYLQKNKIYVDIISILVNKFFDFMWKYPKYFIEKNIVLLFFICYNGERKLEI